jgi:thiosulfate/3-mercaptopyruvate sulfurtransferase
MKSPIGRRYTVRSNLLASLAAFLFLLPATGKSGTTDEPGLLVTTEWLSAHLHDNDLVILHADWTNAGYKKRGHIPGARFLWLNALAKDTPELNTELPSMKEAGAILRDLGITERSRIVVYFDGQNVTMTTRMILTLNYSGLGGRVSLLDGGLEMWKKEGRPITKDIPKFKPGTFVPTRHPEVITNADWLVKHLTDPNVTIIDARASRFYDGTSGPPSGGHIPHALNIPFSSVVDSTNKMLDPEALRQMFVKAGVKPGSQVVTYCHVGQQATLVYFAATYAGYSAKVYDGSFEDWNNRDLPIENPAGKK